MAIIEIIEPTGALTYRMPLDVAFEMPNLGAENKASSVAQHFDYALKGVDDMLETIARVKADPELTELGRSRKIEPKQELVVEVLANRWNAVESEERTLQAREAAFFKPPELDPTHSAMAVEDREMRDWWRGLDVKDRTKMLVRLESEPGNERLMIALLRSPIPVLDGPGGHDIKVVRDAWRRNRRLDDPQTASSIESGLALADWGRRGLSTMAGVVKPFLREWGPDRILRQVLQSSNQATAAGVGLYGFDPVRVAGMRQRLAAEALQRGR